MTIALDMDGTIADFYGVTGWLDDLRANSVRPYVEAKPLCNFSLLARYLNKLQKEGAQICIVSWGSKSGDEAFLREVRKAKEEWLSRHLPSVHWNSIDVVAYGTPKQSIQSGYLWDDEEHNRVDWESVDGNRAFGAETLLKDLQRLL